MNREIDKIIKGISIKLSDMGYIENIINDKDNFVEFEGELLNTYDRFILSHGLPSLCILYGELDNQYSDEEWDLMGHNYIKHIGEIFNQRGVQSLSMFSGLAGVGLSAVCISKNMNRYTKFINNINNYIKINIDEYINNLNEKESLQMYDYDIISGITGIASYCMIFKEDDDMRDVLRKINEYLIDLCGDIEINGTLVPKWYIKSENQFTKVDKEKWKDGCFNTGLAHGIPGILLALTNSMKIGVTVEKQTYSIKKIADILVKFAVNLDDGYSWGSNISLGDFIKNQDVYDVARDAWCYGTPGVSYSLLMCGKLLNNDEYIDYAIKGMRKAIKRTKGIESPTFCHGYSGIAYISYRFYQETKLNEFKYSCDVFKNKILSYYNEEAPFGFYNIENGKNYNFIGIIDGVVGILLTLLAIEYGNKTPWDHAFLISQV